METKLFKEIDDIELNHWWFRGRRKIIFSMLRRFIPVKKNAALDIGFGTGFNAQLLGNFSNKVFGLDNSPVAIQIAQKRNPNLIAFQGAFPEYNFRQSYDIAILLDVLEHIPDDAYAVKKLEALLNIGGVALITVPAFKILWTEHDVLAHHIRRYTKNELQKLISKNSGLIIEKISYFNSFLFPPILFYRFLRKALNLGQGASDFFTVPAVLNKLLETVFSWEAQLLKFTNLPFGVSLICVVRKNNAGEVKTA